MRRYKELDYKKLDTYKQAIDDGFEYRFKDEAGNYEKYFYEVYLYKDFEIEAYVFCDISDFEDYATYEVIEKDWNIFKERVRKYREGFLYRGY